MLFMYLPTIILNPSVCVSYDSCMVLNTHLNVHNIYDYFKIAQRVIQFKFIPV